jgi:hypothetical protein
MAMNYQQLQNAIRSYAEIDSNGLNDTDIATVVQNAENRIYRELNIDAFRLYASAITVTGVSTVSVPAGLRNIRYVELIDSSGNVSNLLEKETSFMAEYNSQPNNTTYWQEPKYWANWDELNWLVAPTPDNNYTINIAYYQQPVSITTTSNSTTYVSTYAQDVLLYASLTETYKYLKGTPDMIQAFEQSYQIAVKSFGDEQLGLRKRDEYTEGELRIPLKTPKR